MDYRREIAAQDQVLLCKSRSVGCGTCMKFEYACDFSDALLMVAAGKVGIRINRVNRPRPAGMP
jgi:hypothetical protein